MSRTQKPYVPLAVRQKREAAIAQVRCAQGWHRMTPTFRPGEQVCTLCGVVTFCPVCLEEQHLPPSRSTRAFPSMRLVHQQAQAQEKSVEVQA